MKTRVIKGDAYWAVADALSSKITYYQNCAKDFRSRGAHSVANEFLSLIEEIKEYASKAGIELVDILYDIED